MTGWQKLWKDPEIVKRWQDRPPLPEVVRMADLLEAEGRRRVLDIGCGIGRHTVYLAARGFEMTATDNAPVAIETCKKNLAEAELRADVIEADMTELPLPDAHFDAAVATRVIHHTDRATLERVIGLITEKLAPRGLFVWETPTPRHCDCGRGREIEPGTWVDPDHREGPVPHHYATEQEVRLLLHAYAIEFLRESTEGEVEATRYHWCVLAGKKRPGGCKPLAR